MAPIQNEVLRLIATETARLTQAADAAALVARSAHERAANARVSYRAAPTAEAESAMMKASIRADMALQDSHSAADAVKTALAAREFVIVALRAEEKGKPSAD
jgi:hypothetical protein